MLPFIVTLLPVCIVVDAKQICDLLAGSQIDLLLPLTRRRAHVKERGSTNTC